jgi:hypothetical protein
MKEIMGQDTTVPVRTTTLLTLYKGIAEQEKDPNYVDLRHLGICPSPTSENLNPQETTNQVAPGIGIDGLLCPVLIAGVEKRTRTEQAQLRDHAHRGGDGKCLINW